MEHEKKKRHFLLNRWFTANTPCIVYVNINCIEIDNGINYKIIETREGDNAVHEDTIIENLAIAGLTTK